MTAFYVMKWWFSLTFTLSGVLLFYLASQGFTVTKDEHNQHGVRGFWFIAPTVALLSLFGATLLVAGVMMMFSIP